MKVQLKNVRLSFPSLFKPSSFEDSDPKFSATFIMDKEVNAKDISRLEKAINEVVKENFKGNHKCLKGVCLRDGEEKTDKEGEYKDGFGPDVMFTTASNKNRPLVLDRKYETDASGNVVKNTAGQPQLARISEEDGKIYAGCFVNVSFNLWAQDNKFGKRVNASLSGVQFVKDGDTFGESRINPENEFGVVEGDEDDNDGLG